MKKGTPDDPKGLIFEAFRIEGITKPECRSIFLDWALSLGPEVQVHAAIERLIAAQGAQQDHPMTEVLNEGLHRMPTPHRRGGWRSRRRD